MNRENTLDNRPPMMTNGEEEMRQLREENERLRKENDELRFERDSYYRSLMFYVREHFDAVPLPSPEELEQFQDIGLLLKELGVKLKEC